MFLCCSRQSLPALALIGISVSALLLVSLLAGPEGSKAARFVHWCGDPAANDWVCHQKGVVFKENETISGRRAVPVEVGAAITTASRSRARLTFKNQATCRLGGDELSRIHVRSGAPSALFTQEQGDSSCTSLYTGQPINVLCDPDEVCETEIRARGTVLIKVPPPGAVASATEVVRRIARIVLCAGFVRVRVESDGASTESASGTSGTSRYVIVVEETSRVIEHEGGRETEDSVHIGFEGREPGPGDCADEGVREQRETVERY